MVLTPTSTYRGIVKFTLESMLNLSKTDKNYNLAADTIYYYENTIVPEGQITLCLALLILLVNL